jgi:hypothetical protein
MGILLYQVLPLKGYADGRKDLLDRIGLQIM